MDVSRSRQNEEENNIEAVRALKKKLDKGVSFEKTMHILHKLQKVPITIKLLEDTKIGYKLRELSKQDNDVGKTAKLLTSAWKEFVRNKRGSDNEPDSEEKESHQEEETVKKREEKKEGEEESLKKKHHHHHHHHKKKKKKSSKEDPNSDDEAKREKKKAKKRHRDEDEEREHKHHRSNDNVDGKADSVVKNGMVASGSNSKTKPVIQPADDIFGSLLGMSDQLKSNSSNRRSQPNSSSTSFSSSVINSASSSSSKTNGVIVQRPGIHKDEILDSLPIATSSRDFDYAQNISTGEKRSTLAQRSIQAQTNHSLAGMKIKGRTAVYAGTSKGSTSVPKVFRLVDCCIRVLAENIDRICEVGDCPFELIKNVLAKCSVQQLRRFEMYNPQLMYESDSLWKEFVEKEFRGREIDDIDSWRDFYNYLVKEREDRLKKITKSISSRQQKAVPERQTQQLLDVRTPREIRRRQERAVGGGGGWGGSSSSSSSRTITSLGGSVTIVNNNRPKLQTPMMKRLNKIRTGKGFRR